MNVFVLSCNHHHAGLEVREKLAFASEDQLTQAYADWRKQHPDSELVLLSTCNRVEVYAATDQESGALSAQHISDFVSQFHNVPSDEFTGSVLSHHGQKAVEHLFDVVCSLDSMVLGEPQIVTQVKDAYRIARENDSCGPLTNILFQRALEVSARVRTNTRLSEGRVSIASVAVGDFGREIFNRFDNKTVLVIGAGEMAEETLRYLKDENAGRIVVINRNRERAEALANAFGGATDSFDQLDKWLAAADIIVSTTGATDTLIDHDRFARIRKNADRKPVFILDLGAPRDFAPSIADIDDNIFLYDIDALEEKCEQNRAMRVSEIKQARKIILEATEHFMHGVYHRATGPVIQRLREQLTDISQTEIDILFRRLPDLDDEQRSAIEKTVHRIVNKVLHPPLETLKVEAKAGTPHSLLDAMKRLFHLGE
ncbi:glutamyl-tRNA reductase [Fuerstiella marisgermanici]|uniref:Glutamyl-tRNA reductase n=1 Tax=Fuerstiella marisgermanici TaxID=1891926 RepID=A0A1P8WJH9_9PLAN|nr:glutamyl-tRNA reductase [Fuerstiella marisgermanici]APZ94212.1 Glutamyl-tRNA reductase [Fuerstiella marisgermanici]